MEMIAFKGEGGGGSKVRGEAEKTKEAAGPGVPPGGEPTQVALFGGRVEVKPVQVKLFGG